MRYGISCLIISSTLQPLLVHVWSLVVLIYPLVVFVFPFSCPLVAIVCPLLVHVCQLLVLVCLFVCPLLVPVSQVVVLVWLFVCLLVVRYVGLFIGDGYSHPIVAVSLSEIGFDSNNEKSHSFTKSLSTLSFHDTQTYYFRKYIYNNPFMPSNKKSPWNWKEPFM